MSKGASNAGPSSSGQSIPAFQGIGKAAVPWYLSTNTPPPNYETSYGPSVKAELQGRAKGLRSIGLGGLATEFQSQATVIAWANLSARTWPELRWLHAIPNGTFYGQDRRAAALHGARMRAAGLKSGICDLFLPAPRHPWHGLYIEMKRKGQKLEPEQSEFIDFAESQGYAAHVCYSADEAIEVIQNHLRLITR